jgi:Ca2+/Na+ antiporter
MSDIAAIKKESDFAVVNIIGSNIFNILRVSAMITPLSSSGITGLDLGVVAAFAWALWGFAATGISHHAQRRTAHAPRLLGLRVLASREDLGSSR